MAAGGGGQQPAGGRGTIQATLSHGGRFIEYNFFGNVFEVTSKYKPPIVPIGKGACGLVCSALNSETGEKVAINTFHNKMDAKRTLREIKLLLQMQHENIIAIKDIIPSPQREAFRDVYVAYELMDADLHQVIRSQVLSDDHIKICDFGLARTISSTNNMTEYVVTRWYRAPELLLNSSDYTPAIDIWSVGCIFMEMMDRKPLFQGINNAHQLHLVMQLLVTPNEADLEFLNQDARRYFCNLPCPATRQSFPEKFAGFDPSAIDLVEKMLTFDPRQRITVEDALAHPYLEFLHNTSDEPVCPMPFSFDFEQQELSEEQMKDLIYQEALAFNPQYQ